MFLRKRKEDGGGPGVRETIKKLHVFGAAWVAMGTGPGQTTSTRYTSSIDDASFFDMIHALTNYLSERQKALTKVAAYTGSAYLISKYITQGLQDARDAAVYDRIAREKYVLSTFLFSFLCFLMDVE